VKIMANIQRHFLISVLLGALGLFVEAPILGGFPALLMRTHAYVQGLQRSTAHLLQCYVPRVYHDAQKLGERHKILQSPYVQLGAGIATVASCYGVYQALGARQTTAPVCSANNSCSQKTINQQNVPLDCKNIIGWQLRRKVMMQQILKKAELKAQWEAELKAQWEEAETERILNDALKIYDEDNAQSNPILNTDVPQALPISPLSNQPSVNPLCRYVSTLNQPVVPPRDEEEHKSERAERELMPILESPTTVERHLLPVNRRASLTDISVPLFSDQPIKPDVDEKSRASEPTRIENINKFIHELRTDACLYCGQTPFRPSKVEQLRLYGWGWVPKIFRSIPLISRISQSASNLLSNYQCPLNRQRMLEHGTEYLDRLNAMNCDEKEASEAQRIYRYFSHTKRAVTKTEKEEYGKYIQAYNYGLGVFTRIQNSDLTAPSTDEITALMNHLVIKSYMLRESGINQSTFVIANGAKLAEALFTHSGLMQDAAVKIGTITVMKGATHFQQYKNVKHYRLKSNLSFLDGKHELLGAVLDEKTGLMYLKLEDHSVAGSLPDLVLHTLGVIPSQIRRIGLLKSCVDLALTTIGREPMKSNDAADYAKEHIMEKLKKIVTSDPSYQSLPKYIKDILSHAQLHKNEESCQGTQAKALCAWLESLFSTSEQELMHMRHGMEVALDFAQRAQKDQPLPLSELS
jgi:hypothetical protein